MKFLSSLFVVLLLTACSNEETKKLPVAQEPIIVEIPEKATPEIRKNPCLVIELTKDSLFAYLDGAKTTLANPKDLDQYLRTRTESFRDCGTSVITDNTTSYKKVTAVIDVLKDSTLHIGKFTLQTDQELQ